MKIRLYSLGATVKKNMTTKTLGDYIELDGQLRDSMDMINPTLIIDISTSANLSTNNANPTLFINLFRQYCYDFTNYVYIVPFNRYYFVNDVIVERTNLLRINLTVDVLESFKAGILAQNVIIDKNELDFTDYLPDENLLTLVKTKTDIVNFPNGLLDSGEFILITAGG